MQAGDLLLGHLDLLECGGDLLEGQIAAIAAERDQRLELLWPHRLLARILIQPLGDRLQRLDITASTATLFPSRGPAPSLRPRKYRELARSRGASSPTLHGRWRPTRPPALHRRTRRAVGDAGHPGEPLPGRRDRGREGDPGQGGRHRRTSTTPTSSASSTSTRARPGSTCRASRKSSARRSTRSCSARRFRAEVLAAHIAQRVRERQGGLRAEVSVTARYPETVTTPVSGIAPRRSTSCFGTAVDSLRGTRTLTGVQAQGMTACPCAQEMVGGAGPRTARRARLRRRADRGGDRGGADRDPQPARHRHPAHRLPRGRPGLDRRAASCCASSSSR